MDGTHFDGVVVGSGFGGPVVAYRLAEAGLRVVSPREGKHILPVHSLAAPRAEPPFSMSPCAVDVSCMAWPWTRRGSHRGPQSTDCVRMTHSQRNVPAAAMAEVSEDLSVIFKVRRKKTALALAEEFVDLYGKRFPKAISVFEAGIGDALSYLRYPGSHHAKIRSTNMLDRLFKEIKRRTRVVEVFPNETSAATLAAEIAFEEQ
jgi:hypothetical protein